MPDVELVDDDELVDNNKPVVTIAIICFCYTVQKSPPLIEVVVAWTAFREYSWQQHIHGTHVPSCDIFVVQRSYHSGIATFSVTKRLPEQIILGGLVARTTAN
jgi:hypothetical protein